MAIQVNKFYRYNWSIETNGTLLLVEEKIAYDSTDTIGVLKRF